VKSLNALYQQVRKTHCKEPSEQRHGERCSWCYPRTCIFSVSSLQYFSISKPSPYLKIRLQFLPYRHLIEQREKELQAGESTAGWQRTFQMSTAEPLLSRRTPQVPSLHTKVAQKAESEGRLAPVSTRSHELRALPSPFCTRRCTLCPQPCLRTAPHPTGHGTTGNTTSLTINNNQQTAVCTELCRARGNRSARPHGTPARDQTPAQAAALSPEPSRAWRWASSPSSSPASSGDSQPRGAGRRGPSASPQNARPLPPQPLARLPPSTAPRGSFPPRPPPAAHDAPHTAGWPPCSLTSAGRADDAAPGAAGVSTVG